MPLQKDSTYYYTAISYAYNDSYPFDQMTMQGQRYRYLESTKPLKITAIDNFSNFLNDDHDQYIVVNQINRLKIYQINSPLSIILYDQYGRQIEEWKNYKSSFEITNEDLNLKGGIYFFKVINISNGHVNTYNTIFISDN